VLVTFFLVLLTQADDFLDDFKVEAFALAERVNDNETAGSIV
jgi:hypothetical protein